jgi:putative DNA primase/helicase
MTGLSFLQRPLATDHPAAEFRAVLEAAGLQPGDVSADGVLRRCPTVDHPKSQNGAYKLFEDGRGGWFEDHANGTGVQFWAANGAEPLTEAERESHQKEIEAARVERERQQAEAQAEAVTKARRYLAALPPASDANGYLIRKGVKAVAGLLADGDSLIVPIKGADGQPISYQRIPPDGKGKRFPKGCPVACGWFAIKGDGGPLAICEGIATGLSIYQASGGTVLCAFSAGNLAAVARMAQTRYPERIIILAADNDTETEARTGKNPGLEAARTAAAAVGGLLAVPEAGGDFNDLATAEGPEAVKARIEAARPVNPEGGAEAGEDYPEPMALPDGLPPVAPFEMALLPETLRPWAADIIDRMQCSGDYVAVTILAALGAVIGRRIGIRPQSSTDWTVTPNQWAMLIGRPGVLKSPAMEAALGPVKRLAALAVERYQVEAADYEHAKIAEKLRAEAAEKAARVALKKDPGADLSGILTVETAEAPNMTRYMANNTTAAALGELHRQNPNGLLVFRDELVSLLRSLDQEENSEARGFYLTGWNGDSPYTFDRITRGMHLHIPAVCLSLLGSTQPARIGSYVKCAVTGTGDDGLLQRFGLTVWPDTGGTWRDVDRWPDNEAKREAWRVFDQLARLTPFTLGAKQDTDPDGGPEGIPYLRFDPAGLDLFRTWRQDLEARLRAGDLHPAMESHLAKYRKLVPGLALICHLAEGASGPVGRPATLRALAWAEYLETHARRLYASVAAPDAATARAIVAKIRSGELSGVLGVRQVWKFGWSGLTDLDQVKAGFKMLADYDWLIETRKNTGGRPTFEYRLNPKTEGMR